MERFIAVLKAVFGTDEEVRMDARASMEDAAYAIDEMRKNTQRMQEASRPASNLDEAFRQMTEQR